MYVTAVHERWAAARAAMVALCATGTVLVAVLGGSTPAGSAEPETYITVSYEAGPGSTECLPPREAATGSVNDDGKAFTLTINAKAPMCEPLTAVVYAMPDNPFYPWPQTKVEAQTFDVEPGITTVSFAKGCSSLQFDVVSGRTPDRIQPNTGPMHGPLLFEWFPWSAQMYWGTSCASTPGVTPTTVAGPSPTPGTPIGDPGVAGTTQLPPAGGNPATGVATPVGDSGAIAPAVRGVSATPAAASPSVAGTALPNTGNNVGPVVFAGAMLVLVGSAMVRSQARSSRRSTGASPFGLFSGDD